MTDATGNARQRRHVPKLPALLVPADPTLPVQTIDLASGDSSLSQLQAAVGGLVDVQAHDVQEMWFNDEGRDIGLPMNIRASHYILNDSPWADHGLHLETALLYGPVVVTGPADGAGDITPVRDEVVAYFSGLDLHEDSLRDWNVRSTDWQVTEWLDFPDGLGRPDDGGMER